MVLFLCIHFQVSLKTKAFSRNNALTLCWASIWSVKSHNTVICAALDQSRAVAVNQCHWCVSHQKKQQHRCEIGDGGKTREGDNWSQAPSVPCTLYPAPPAPDFWHPLVPPVPCTRVLVPPVPCTRVLVTPLLLLSPAATVQLLKSPRFTVFFCFLTRRCSFFPPFLIFNFLTTCIVGCTISNSWNSCIL